MVQINTLKELVEKLQNIEVLEYSEQDGSVHRGELNQHIIYNVKSPDNPYVIVDLGNIPAWVYDEYPELLKNIRIKKPNEIDFSKAKIDIPELGILLTRDEDDDIW